jgi:predicted deacylase
LANSGQLLAKVIIVPVANPIGLGQVLQASHLGRFHLGTGQNFNRGFADLARDVDVGALLTGEIPQSPARIHNRIPV